MVWDFSLRCLLLVLAGNAVCRRANSALRMHEARALVAWVWFITEVLASGKFNDAHVTRFFVVFPFCRARWPRRLSRLLLASLYNKLESRYRLLVHRALASTDLKEVQSRIGAFADLAATR